MLRKIQNPLRFCSGYVTLHTCYMLVINKLAILYNLIIDRKEKLTWEILFWYRVFFLDLIYSMKVYFMSLLFIFIFFSFCARDFLSLILLILFLPYFFSGSPLYFLFLYFLIILLTLFIWKLSLQFGLFASYISRISINLSGWLLLREFWSRFFAIFFSFSLCLWAFLQILLRFSYCAKKVLFLFRLCFIPFFSIILCTCSCFLIMQFVSSVFSYYYFYISLLINLFVLI